MDYHAYSQHIWNQTNSGKFQTLDKKLKNQTQKYLLGTNWRSDIRITHQVGKWQSGRQTDRIIDLLTDRIPCKTKRPTGQLTKRPSDW